MLCRFSLVNNKLVSLFSFQGISLNKLVFLTVRVHLFPFRTQKLSSPVPKILVWRRTGKIGQCQHSAARNRGAVFLLFYSFYVIVYEKL